MRKLTVLLAASILFVYLFPVPIVTFPVLAEGNSSFEKISVSENDVNTINTGSSGIEGASGAGISAGTEESSGDSDDEEADNLNATGLETQSGEEAEPITSSAADTYKTEEDAARMEEASNALKNILGDHTVIALVYLCDEYSIRMEALYDSNAVITVPSGQQVQIKDVLADENDELWVYVTLYFQEAEYSGYIPRAYLACSDEVFLEWEESYNNSSGKVLPFAAARSAIQTYADIEQFPDSYKAALTALKQAHPKWTFVKMNTNLDWNYVVSEEIKDGRSLVESYLPAYMQEGKYSEKWSYASKGALEHYLDPRNGLNESRIFQFELLTYNESYHTQAAVQSFLNQTFMAGTAPKTSLTYANIFWTVGSALKVSPFHLACRVYQEQGKGTSSLISGVYSGYEGYYNYFNIAATGNNDKAVIESGLARAKAEGWTDGYTAILGGAKVISQNYILKGQDTLYLQKFDVDGSYNGLFWHQYMQNICAPANEGENIRKLYNSAGSLDNTFVFKIPVYNNMPPEACSIPTISYSVSLAPPAGYSDANIYLDGIGYAATVRDGKYVVTAAGGNVKTAVMYKYNGANVPIGMYVWTLKHNGTVYEATAVPELEDILSYHGFSIRITGKSGIRFKTGISSSLRSQLVSGGTAGYVLKEYGTLVMNNSNRAQYPLVKGGEKVLSGMSYGKNADGILEDKIYETVSGRHRFTSVLVGLPANQYKVEYAFRGYIILTKDNAEVILYGPTVWKSIYLLANQVLSGGQYEKNSSADLFLRKLIEDADKAGG
ncbi:beta-N-acetylglucosaminidase [Kineothrix alysoides]|uniref:Beta-N-acetylglucosaminidase n=1 Tax=Kineothrix alysoides TaxID=1469948 RepID=A0A4R1QXK6_9FIRM|nr:hypothetical protein [Kineothrix alysoides]TCL56624.1 beta-N-acetylglucosaminidase [Kineothrix alysoides]